MRDLILSDLVELEKQAQFPVNFLVNKPKIFEKTFEDEKGLIGSIFVTATAEITAIFADRSTRDKVKVFQCLPEILYRDLHPKGYRDFHTFIKGNDKYANLLIKHFGFEDVEGRALVRRF